MIYYLNQKKTGNIVLYIAIILVMYIFSICICHINVYLFPTYRAYFQVLGKYIFVLPYLILCLDCMIAYIISCKENRTLNMIKEMAMPLEILAFSLIFLLFNFQQTQKELLLMCDLPNILFGHKITREVDDVKIYTIEKERGMRNTRYTYYHFAKVEGETYLISDEMENEDFQRMVNDFLNDEENNRPKELDKGHFIITYLPNSRCMLKINFIPEKEKQ